MQEKFCPLIRYTCSLLITILLFFPYRSETTQASSQQRAELQSPRMIAYRYNNNLWTILENGLERRKITNATYINAYEWSPDGKEIAYITDNSAHEGDIYVINADGSNPRQITSGLLANSWVIDWRLSKIFFLHMTNKVNNCFTIAYVDMDDSVKSVIDITPPVCILGAGISSKLMLRASPDGKWIAIAYGRSGLCGNGLCNSVISVDGKTVYTFAYKRPDWKHDSSSLLYLISSSTGIKTLDPNANQFGVLSQASATVAVYAPDDQWIAYTDNYALRKMKVDQSGMTVLANGAVTDPDWSPNADKIVYTEIDPSSPWGDSTAINIINSDGSGKQQLAPAYASDPKWARPEVNLPATIQGKVTVPVPQKGAVALKEILVELLHDNQVITTTTAGGTGPEAGRYTFVLPEYDSGMYRVRATLVQPANPVKGIAGFQVKFMRQADHPVPWMQTEEFVITERIVNKDIVFNPQSIPPGVTTNLEPEHRANLDDLAVVYIHIQQAEDFAIHQLGVTTLGNAEVRAFSQEGTSYVFNGSQGIIFIDQAEINSQHRPENREWHEYFHHMMAYTTYAQLASPRSCGNHMGFLNETTDDSWIEGWAAFWAEYLDQYLTYKDPGVYLSWSLDINKRTWDFDQDKTQIVQREDLAVASLLWDLQDRARILFGQPVWWDDDPFSESALTLQDLKELMVENLSQSYTQIHTIQGLYQRLIARYPTERVNALFKSHGFFGDRGWVMAGCGQPSQQGNKKYDTAPTPEVYGQGGRDGRSNTPLLNDANIKIHITGERGNARPSGTVLIRYIFPSPDEGYNITFSKWVSNGELLNVNPPSVDTPMTIEVKGSSPGSPVFTISNIDYWDAVETTQVGYVAEVHLIVSDSELYLPLVSQR